MLVVENVSYTIIVYLSTNAKHSEKLWNGLFNRRRDQKEESKKIEVEDKLNNQLLNQEEPGHIKD